MDGAFQTIATLLEELFGHVDSDGDGALDEEDDLCCRGSDMVPSVMGALLFHSFELFCPYLIPYVVQPLQTPLFVSAPMSFVASASLM